MNFSDETVENVTIAMRESCDNYKCQWVHTSPETKEYWYRKTRAALQSLTLADLMQVDEVREMVEASGKVIKRSSDATDANHNQPMMLVYEKDLDALMASHDKFTEAK